MVRSSLVPKKYLCVHQLKTNQERIPRHGARDVVFYLHGVLDTSMSWVSGGVTGSQAFAAWEAGFDVWLGNTRNNAPRWELEGLVTCHVTCPPDPW